MVTEEMSWERLIELEPRLPRLYNRAVAIRTGKRRFNPLEISIGRRTSMKDEMKAGEVAVDLHAIDAQGGAR